LIVGLGIDVVELVRFEASLTRTPALRAKLFTPAEAELPLQSLGARLAA
jgi:holo-[acyl-carrier protein] synthase